MAVTTWNIDPAHTEVQFSTKHMMVTTVRGRFTAVEGSITLDEEEPTNSTGSFTVGVASLNTGVEQRDGHLRSADFFDTDNHPTATFSATKVESKGGSDYRVDGDLTIRGTTRPVSFEVELLGFYTGMDGARRAGLHATGRINREDFGLTWNVALESGGWLVGRDIRLELDLAIELAKPAAEPSVSEDTAIAA
jgi:polyisoprenoid-binding protein YceI